jgi:hypothetical protein
MLSLDPANFTNQPKGLSNKWKSAWPISQEYEAYHENPRNGEKLCMVAGEKAALRLVISENYL